MWHRSGHKRPGVLGVLRDDPPTGEGAGAVWIAGAAGAWWERARVEPTRRRFVADSSHEDTVPATSLHLDSSVLVLAP